MTDLVGLARTGPVHFMGVGGAGMCALAEMVLREGGRVTGCDLKESGATRRLEELGAAIDAGHDPAHVEEALAVVVTAAVPSDHPELVRARERGIPVVKRAEALGSVVNAGRVVAVAGTHGKTSTTALTVHLLETAEMDPTGFVGGSVPAWGGNLRRGESDLFVVEADEYDRSFHHLRPHVAVVTNLEADHLDIYGSLDGVRSAFGIFLDGLRPGGAAVICADDPGASSLLTRVEERAFTYGLSAGSMLRAHEVTTGPEGTRFRLTERGEDRGPARLPLHGVHNLRNALAAAAVARELGADWAAIRRGWEGYRGVGRRFQFLGTAAGVSVIDDYAHHPTEIRVALNAARDAMPGRPLVAAFQPHLYSRTRDFAGDFGRALATADRVWVTDVFPAREDPIPGIDAGLVVREVRAAGGEVRHHSDVDTLARALAGELEGGEVLVLMGAGSIERVGPAVMAELGTAETAGGRRAR
jgi:UDP-N-acetylmuramate--alanine ligase